MANTPLFITDAEADNASGRQPPSRTRASLWSSAEETLQKVQSIQIVHSTLQHTTATLLDAATKGTLDTHSLQTQLRENLSAMSKVQSFLDTVLDSFPWSMKPTPQSAVKAKQVLSTSELLEQILLELNTPDILKVG